jgi:hypothetical protein
MAQFNFTAASGNDVLLLACPFCDHKQAYTVSAIIRGGESFCEACGTVIETLPGAPTARSVRLRAKTPSDEQELEVTIRRDGPWVFLDDAERSVVSSLEHDSDRAVAIIIGSLIENRLHRAILARISRDAAIEARLFQISGPLGTFSAKIDFARIIGLVSSEAHADLVLFKDIRNLFAHNLGIRDFRSQKITDKSKNLRLIDSYVGDIKASDGGRGIIALESGAIPKIFVRQFEQRKTRGRDRYLMTAQLLTVCLAHADLRSWPLPLI